VKKVQKLAVGLAGPQVRSSGETERDLRRNHASAFDLAVQCLPESRFGRVENHDDLKRRTRRSLTRHGG
jgi:hypothetical protein